MNKDNTIILQEPQGIYILLVENEARKKEAIRIIKNGGIVDFGCSEDITNEEFEEYKKQGYTIMKL